MINIPYLLRAILYSFVIIFSIFLLYQLLRVIFGGSWSTEQIVIALVILNTTLLFSLSIFVARMQADINYLKRDVSDICMHADSLSRDYHRLSTAFVNHKEMHKRR